MSKNNNISKVATDLVGQPMFTIMKKVLKIEKLGKKINHFELGDPDFEAPKNVVEAIQKAMVDGHTHYSPSSGLPAFREAIKFNLENEFNLKCDYEQIVVTPGANSGIYWTIKCLVNEGEEVLIPDPGFPTFYAAAKASLAKVKRYRLLDSNNFLPDLDEIKNLITDKTRLIIINSPSNPIGSIIPNHILSEIYELAVKKNIYILSDDVYRRLSFNSDYAPSITSIDECKNITIMLGSLSKEYSMTGFRLGYLVGPKKIIEKIGIYIETVNSCVAPFLQIGGIEALLGSQDYRKEIFIKLKERRNMMVNGLNQISNISCHLSEGGLYVFPKISNTGMDGSKFFELMLNSAKIACVPGVMFGDSGKNHVRMSLNADLNLIQKSLEQIDLSLKEILFDKNKYK